MIAGSHFKHPESEQTVPLTTYENFYPEHRKLKTTHKRLHLYIVFACV